jgi:autotransporter-associated beta strand protein
MDEQVGVSRYPAPFMLLPLQVRRRRWSDPRAVGARGVSEKNAPASTSMAVSREKGGRTLLLTLTILFSIACTPAAAVTYTWTGNAPNGNWSDSRNWDGNGVPHSGNNAIVFASNASGFSPFQNLDPNFAFSTLTIGPGWDGSTVSGFGFAAGYNMVTSIVNNSAGDTTISSTFYIETSNNTSGMNLEGSGAGAITLSNVLSSIPGKGLNVNATGSYVLTAANTYTGATSVTSGTLVAANNYAFGDSGGGATVSGATLALQGNINLQEQSITLNSNGVLHNRSGNRGHFDAFRHERLHRRHNSLGR